MQPVVKAKTADGSTGNKDKQPAAGTGDVKQPITGGSDKKPEDKVQPTVPATKPATENKDPAAGTKEPTTAPKTPATDPNKH